MINPYRKEIFPISIYHGSVENNDRLKDMLIPYIFKKVKDENVNNDPPGGWFTKSLKTSFDNKDVIEDLWNPDDDNDIAKELRRQYLKVIDQFFMHEEWSAEIDHVWYNYYVDGEYQEAHKHLGKYNDNITFAFVHFLSYDPENHAPLIFGDPMEDIKSMQPKLCPAQDPTDSKYIPRIKEGDVMMFPCWLEHEVRPGKRTPDYPRVSVALNINVNEFGPDDD